MVNVLLGCKCTSEYICNGALSRKKVQNSQENTSTGVSFLKSYMSLSCNFTEKRTSTQVFSDEFYKILKTSFLQNTSRRFCSTEKYFTNKIVKNSLRKEKKMETACQKNKNLISIYIKSSYPFAIQKLRYFSFLCFPLYNESTSF